MPSVRRRNTTQSARPELREARHETLQLARKKGYRALCDLWRKRARVHLHFNGRASAACKSPSSVPEGLQSQASAAPPLVSSKHPPTRAAFVAWARGRSAKSNRCRSPTPLLIRFDLAVRLYSWTEQWPGVCVFAVDRPCAEVRAELYAL